MLRLVSAGIAFGLLWGLAAAPARAQPKVSPEYMKHYKAGVAAYHLGEYPRARGELEKARKLDPALPGAYRYLALVDEQEKKYQSCLRNAALAVEKNPGSETAPKIRQNHDRCRKALNRPAFQGEFGQGGAIAIITEVTGAAVKINGLRYGATPFEPRAVATGMVEVQLEKEGYLPFSTKAKVLPGLVTDVIVELARDPNYKPPKTPMQKEVMNGWLTLRVTPKDATVLLDGKRPELDQQGRIAAAPGTYVAVVEREGYEPWRRRVRVIKGQNRTIDVLLRSQAARRALRKKGYTFLGAAAVFTLSGAVFALLERRKFEETQDIYDSETARPMGTDTSVFPIRTRDQIDELASSGKKLALISNISYGLAAVSLGVSIWYFIKERSHERKGVPLPIAVTPLVPGFDGSRGVGMTATYSREIDW